MKAHFILLILIAHTFSYTNGMYEYHQESSEFAFNMVFKHKYHWRTENNSSNLSETLEKELIAIIEYAGFQLNKLTSEYSDFIFLLPRELPSLTVAFIGTPKQNTNFIEWHNRTEFRKFYQLSKAKLIQYKKFKTRLKQILIDIKTQLESLELCSRDLIEQSSIKLRIQLHHQELEEEQECSLLNPFISCLNYLPKISTLYRW